MEDKGRFLPRLALYTFLSGWIGFLIYAVLSYEGPHFSLFTHHFLSPEHGGIRYRALVLFAPLLSTILGFLIYEREKFLRKTLSSSDEIDALNADLQIANEELINIVDELRTSEEQTRSSRQTLQTIMDSMPFGVAVIGKDMKVRHVNNAALERIGYDSEEELLGKRCKDTFCADDCECPILERGVELDRSERVVLSRERREIPVMKSALPIKLDGEEVILEAFVDITERKQAEGKIRLQLEQLRALRTIDLAITGSFDIGIVINVFLDQAISQLKADAAGILLFNRNLLCLGQGFGRGFRTDVYNGLSITLGEGLAGRVALERKALLLTDIAGKDMDSGGVQGLLLAEEGFRAYFGVPLVVKGQVKGVLEIYHRTGMLPEKEWLDFLYALAGQAAIAIDNSTMFDELQYSKDELMMAYDKTIEGWAKALDYRDKETEGHSRRVTDLTVEIAGGMGIGGEDILHIRRGALLHDIGKLGVPDAVLFKPGKLTEEEWVQMKRHPDIARDLLSPIGYLSPAIDIPYCHHEKWDGSGYPRGLWGKQVPLAARIFAVVDVWDALRSDRPYRKAWPVDKTLDFIRSEAGKHFDPEVVEVFLKEKDSSGGR